MSNGKDDWDIGDMVPFSNLDGGEPGSLSGVALGFGVTVTQMADEADAVECQEIVDRFETGRISDVEMIKLLQGVVGDEAIKDALRRFASLVYYGSTIDKDKIADREPLKKQEDKVRNIVDDLRERTKE